MRQTANRAFGSSPFSSVGTSLRVCSSLVEFFGNRSGDALFLAQHVPSHLPYNTCETFANNLVSGDGEESRRR